MINGRFTGTVERLGFVNTRDVSPWITAIPFTEWPQQDPIHGQLRPAMVNDREWQGFGAATDRLVTTILAQTGGRELGRVLSVVMPGQSIDPHVDKVAPEWWGRVHVPLVSDPRSWFVVGGTPHHLAPGWAYLVNITAEHSVEHRGVTPRIHFMLDIGAPS